MFTGEWIDKMCYIHITDYLAKQKKEKGRPRRLGRMFFAFLGWEREHREDKESMCIHKRL